MQGSLTSKKTSNGILINSDKLVRLRRLLLHVSSTELLPSLAARVLR